MKKIPSFTKNHNELKVGLHKCTVISGVTTWDLRFKKPNADDFISPKALHTIEHLLATVLRNSEMADDVVYFGPMGCRTGFYLLTTNLTYDEVLALLKISIKKALAFTTIPGDKKEECGNYLEHDLKDALQECEKYLNVLHTL